MDHPNTHDEPERESANADEPDCYDDILRDIADISSGMRDLVTNLRDGGPPVDVDEIDLYVRGGLDARSQELVGTQIVTWKRWWVASWRAELEWDRERCKARNEGRGDGA